MSIVVSGRHTLYWTCWTEIAGYNGLETPACFYVRCWWRCRLGVPPDTPITRHKPPRHQKNPLQDAKTKISLPKICLYIYIYIYIYIHTHTHTHTHTHIYIYINPYDSTYISLIIRFKILISAKPKATSDPPYSMLYRPYIVTAANKLCPFNTMAPLREAVLRAISLTIN